MSPLAAITIDVDSLNCYHEIHGLPQAQRPAKDPIYTRAMPRFWKLLDEVGAPATVFAIAKDAAHYPEAFHDAHKRGSEIASHSFAHDYRLTQRSATEIRADLQSADEILQKLAPNGRVVGFRAPGYNVSHALLQTIVELGYHYDSSLLPAPLYFGARAGVIGLYQLSKKPSRSIMGDPRAFWGPLTPYRASTVSPWKPVSHSPLFEVPISCEPLTRFPLIGTYWTVLPRRLRNRLLDRMLDRLPFLNFEMHAIDLLDATDEGVPTDLAKRQRDLQIPVAEKVSAFRELFHRIAERSSLTTLAAFVARTK